MGLDFIPAWMTGGIEKFRFANFPIAIKLNKLSYHPGICIEADNDFLESFWGNRDEVPSILQHKLALVAWQFINEANFLFVSPVLGLCCQCSDVCLVHSATVFSEGY